MNLYMIFISHFWDMILIWSLWAVIGAGIAIFIWKIPERWVRPLNKFISPCQVTFWSVPITWVGCFLVVLSVERGHADWYTYAGMMLVSFGRGLDLFDGRFARILQEWLKLVPPVSFRKSFSYRGTSEWGEILDPLMDKCAVIPMYLYVGYKYYMMIFKNGLVTTFDWVIFVCIILICLGILMDIIGSIIRMDYFKRKGIVKGKGATWAGKIKSISQWFWLTLYFVQGFNWVPDYQVGYSIILTIVLSLVVGLGTLSVLTKLFRWKSSWTASLKRT